VRRAVCLTQKKGKEKVVIIIICLSAIISAFVLFSLLKTNESTAAAGAIRTVRVGGTARGTVLVCVLFFSLLLLGSSSSFAFFFFSD
jgi:hypothetical protein